jgi:uncharacterized protein with HEPN domain
MTAARNRITHGYYSVDLEVLCPLAVEEMLGVTA